MGIGFVLALLGVVLMLRSYSNSPAAFNTGLALGAIGVLLVVINALRSDKARQHGTNGNGA